MTQENLEFLGLRIFHLGTSYEALEFPVLGLTAYFFFLPCRSVPLSMDGSPPSTESLPSHGFWTMGWVTGSTSACSYPWVNLTSMEKAPPSMDPIHPWFARNIINLAAEAFWYGKISEAFISEIESEYVLADNAKELETWRKYGPMRKLHDIVTFICRTPQRREAFTPALRSRSKYCYAWYRSCGELQSAKSSCR